LSIESLVLSAVWHHFSGPSCFPLD